MAANDNNEAGEWVVCFVPKRYLVALDRYRLEEAKLDSRSAALRQAFQDWGGSHGLCQPQ